MSAPVRPANVASGSPLLPWLIPLIAGIAVAASTTLWIAGGLGSVFAGLGWPAACPPGHHPVGLTALRALSIALGLAGVLMILRPGAGLLQPAALAALGG